MATAHIQHLCLHCGTPSVEVYCCQACKILDANWGVLPTVKNTENPYAYLDQNEFRDLYIHKQNPRDEEYLFYAEGLHCSSCVHLLEKLPQYCTEVLSAKVNFAHGSVWVRIQKGASLAQVAHVIEELGYKPSLISPGEDISKKFLKENRGNLNRIAVAGFCAGNMMLFVIPVYAGLSGTWSQIFNFLSFLLFLPILFYSATPFYRGAWVALKYQQINVDLPITLALLLGFSLSTFNLLRGIGHIYFDSTASFLFFILCARYLLKRVQQNYLAPLKIRTYLKDQKFLRQIHNQWVPAPTKDLKAGDVLKISPGQNIPADARLLSASAQLDMSLFNGESLPRIFSQGMPLFAGTTLLSDNIEIELTGSVGESRLGKLFKELENGGLTKSSFISLTDSLAQKLILAVFILAVAFFIFYAPTDAQEAFNRSLALIVLACPCALAFGSPLTYGLALKTAQKKGILLKDASHLEKLLTLQHVFFDKTGTLTQGSLKLHESVPTQVSAELKNIILSLEASSFHPIAFALREAWKETTVILTIQDREEILGRGVRGHYLGHHYEIRQLSESLHDCELGVEVLKDGRSQCRLYFTDSLRVDSKNVVAAITHKNLTCHLLSGDKKSRVVEIAKECGIPLLNTASELFPEEKKAYIQRFHHTCMIGDGANDSLGLQAADVGIAVKGSVDLSLHSADIYFTRGGLMPFLDLLDLAAKTRTVLIRNLSISLIYNVLGGTCALLGFINPMMAAILMPISSAFIIVSTLWGFR